ncbi:MAG TPA: hypothetical protein PLS29_08975, partial [Acidimicrobiales bacterium]|nr:hypothetical protein [Acidimicrobiales bacterium]
FSMWVTFASGYQVVYQALVVVAVGLVFYAFIAARRPRHEVSASTLDEYGHLTVDMALSLGEAKTTPEGGPVSVPER